MATYRPIIPEPFDLMTYLLNRIARSHEIRQQEEGEIWLATQPIAQPITQSITQLTTQQQPLQQAISGEKGGEHIGEQAEHGHQRSYHQGHSLHTSKPGHQAILRRRSRSRYLQQQRTTIATSRLHSVREGVKDYGPGLATRRNKRRITRRS